MRNRTVSAMVALLVLVLVASTGCVAKKLFRSNAEKTDSRIASSESAVEANERRIADLRTETDSKIADLEGATERAVEVGETALSRADEAAMAADKAARGRLLWSLTLSDERVKFSFNQASFPDEAAAMLDELVNKVKAYDKAVYIEIEGHTDNIGGEDYNHRLGEKRAVAVRNYLNRQGGIPLHAMNTISYGESQPASDNGTREGRAANRRVVIKVLE